MALRNGDAKLKDALTKWYQETGALSRRQNMVRDAQSEPNVLIHVREMDSNNWELNCLNGVVDLESGEFREHDQSRRPIHTKLVNASYNPDAKCPIWEHCLEMWMAGNQNLIRYLQRMAGWMLTGTVLEQAFFVLYGPGENGKSTFVKILMNILGNYAQSADPSLVMSAGDQRQTSPSSLAAIAKLRGARLVVCSETAQGQYLSEDQVKRLSSEEDISAKFMGKDFFDFPPTHKAILQTNFRPRVYSGGKGTWRRIKPIPFLMQISEDRKDPKLKEKLAAEYAGILQWMLAGCRAWQAQNCKMIDPPEIHQAVDEYKAESDRLGEFLEDCVEKTGTGDSTVEMMNRTYQAWYRQTKGVPVDGKGMRMFLDALRDKGYKQGRGTRGVRLWKGIKLLEGSTAYQQAMREQL
jgi:putative DNA primase/helicase